MKQIKENKKDVKASKCQRRTQIRSQTNSIFKSPLIKLTFEKCLKAKITINTPKTCKKSDFIETRKNLYYFIANYIIFMVFICNILCFTL